jgi:hypothetical protein
MDRYQYQFANRHALAQEARAHMTKALQPMKRHCYIRDIDVNILVEYPEYKNPNVKGPEGEIYCENIAHCFHESVRCRWSGLNPRYPDPFHPDAPKHKPIVF